MDSRDALVGTQVRLIDGNKRNGKGAVGTIERTYGHPDYLALDVRFEDGAAELCWHHELAREGVAPAREAPSAATRNATRTGWSTNASAEERGHE